jgi:hypothetical protein
MWTGGLSLFYTVSVITVPSMRRSLKEKSGPRQRSGFRRGEAKTDSVFGRTTCDHIDMSPTTGPTWRFCAPLPTFD